MPSATLTSDLSRSKRFRQPQWQARLSLGLLMAGLGLGVLFVGKGAYHVVAGLFWICSETMWLSFALAVWWEFRVEGVYERNYFSSLLLPYEDILVVADGDDNAEAVEIHYAQISPEIFPRARMTITLSKRADFLDALLERAPNAEFRT